MDTISNAALENVTGGSFLSDAGDTVVNSAFASGAAGLSGTAYAYLRGMRTPHLSIAQTRGLFAHRAAMWGAGIGAAATVATKAYNALTK